MLLVSVLSGLCAQQGAPHACRVRALARAGGYCMYCSRVFCCDEELVIAAVEK